MQEPTLLGVTRLRENGDIALISRAKAYLQVQEGEYLGFYSHPDGVLLTKVDIKRVDKYKEWDEKEYWRQKFEKPSVSSTPPLSL